MPSTQRDHLCKIPKHFLAIGNYSNKTSNKCNYCALNTSGWSAGCRLHSGTCGSPSVCEQKEAVEQEKNVPNQYLVWPPMIYLVKICGLNVSASSGSHVRFIDLQADFSKAGSFRSCEEGPAVSCSGAAVYLFVLSPAFRKHLIIRKSQLLCTKRLLLASGRTLTTDGVFCPQPQGSAPCENTTQCDTIARLPLRLEGHFWKDEGEGSHYINQCHEWCWPCWERSRYQDYLNENRSKCSWIGS